MTQPPSGTAHALSLEVREHDGKVEVALIGHAPEAVAVSYQLELSGKSQSRHRGRTTLAADAPVRLSVMTVDAGENWCVKLVAEEQGREPYEIRKGSCPGDPG